MFEFIVGFVAGTFAGPAALAAYRKWRASKEPTAAAKGTITPPGGGGGPGEPKP